MRTPHWGSGYTELSNNTGLNIFALSFVLFCVNLGLLYNEFKASSSTLSPNDVVRFEYNFVIEAFAYIMFGTPALLIELSCIRSIYRILKYKAFGITRIYWMVSAILSFFSFVFLLLMFTGVLDFTK